MVTIIIRKSTLEDLKSVQDLSTELAHSDFPYDKEINLDWAYTKNGEKYYKERIQKGLCVVATNNGTIVGYATFAIKVVPTWRLVKVAELENLFVTKKVRNKDVGRILINDFFAWARINRANKVCVNVFFPNKRATKFYNRQGFKRYDLNLEMSL